MSDWRTDVLKGMGAPVTKKNLDFLASWQRWEGGHTKNAARWNWLNTTSNAPGAVRSINSVGVKAFDSYAHGVQATIQTLNNGNYGDIVSGLRSGDPYSANPRRGLGTWVAGPKAANSSHAQGYADRVLGTHTPVKVAQRPAGQGNASVRPGGQTYGGGVSPLQIEAGSDSDAMYRKAMAGFMLGRAAARREGRDPQGGLMELAALRQQYQSMGGVPEAPEQEPGRESTRAVQRPVSDVVDGNILIPTIGKGTHVTDGLDWNHGQRTARDIMAKPGTVVGAPEDGVVIRHGSAQGGEALYFRGKSGRMYWLGHIENIIPVGTTVKAGRALARISADHARPHLHFDYKL